MKIYTNKHTPRPQRRERCIFKSHTKVPDIPYDEQQKKRSRATHKHTYTHTQVKLLKMENFVVDLCVFFFINIIRGS